VAPVRATVSKVATLDSHCNCERQVCGLPDVASEESIFVSCEVLGQFGS